MSLANHFKRPLGINCRSSISSRLWLAGGTTRLVYDTVLVVTVDLPLAYRLIQTHGLGAYKVDVTVDDVVMVFEAVLISVVIMVVVPVAVVRT